MAPSQVHSHGHPHTHSNLNAFTLQDQLLHATKRQVLSRNNSYSTPTATNTSTTTTSVQQASTLQLTNAEDEIQERDTFKLVLWTTSACLLIYHVPYLVFGTVAGITDIPYNKKRSGKTLDIYIPDRPNKNVDQDQATFTNDNNKNNKDKNALLPVIVFIYGGAWCSGSKKTYTLIGARFRALGYIVIIPEYTTFPAGLVRDMQEDIRMAVQWTHQNCRRYGGDPDRIYLMGHSAGAHLCALTIIHDCVKRAVTGANSKEVTSLTIAQQSTLLQALLSDQTPFRERSSQSDQQDDENNENDNHLPQLHGLILCSGVYEIAAHLEHEKVRGVEEVSAMSRVMGESSLMFDMSSPTTIIQEVLRESSSLLSDTESLHHRARAYLPRNILVVHGAEDRTVPSSSSVRFHKALQGMHLDSGAVRLKVFPVMAHQAPVVGIMPSYKKESPFCQLLLDEYTAFMS
ncbi:hypothetical protein BGZ83_005057 [Gryganskiella cystojenkinii]|nr:hypothetical protein BGZ83_005057 [Gryganskiella cystojenkinii]